MHLVLDKTASSAISSWLPIKSKKKYEIALPDLTNGECAIKNINEPEGRFILGLQSLPFIYSQVTTCQTRDKSY